MEVRSQRKAFGQKLVDMGKINNNIVVLEADLGGSTQSCLFKKAHPDRFFEMGIAEQNMASTAAGLSLVGKIPYINTFAVFATGRAYDQIRQGICIPKLNVRICGASAGFSDFGDGSTHQGVEDVAIMRAIPNMTVLVPADAIEAEKMVEATVAYKGPVYIRISKSDLPVVTKQEEEYKIGKVFTIKEGKDAVVFANGIMVSKALEAAERLAKEGIELKVVNVSTVKPLDKKAIVEIVKEYEFAVTAEEHSIIGGLGSAISETLSNENINIEMIGVKDVFGTSAHNHEELLDAYGLTEDNIIKAIKKHI